MDDRNIIHHSQNPDPKDVARLEGFVSALKEAGKIAPAATTEEAVGEIFRMRAAAELDKARSMPPKPPTLGAFGAAQKP